ncbi:MAG: hypothetical protein K0R38_1835 [Polyangiaceae bacterium]|nr:hypothetical protein [Polyangiaceae bacterium]
MENKEKSPGPPEQVTAHPEIKPPPQRVPGDQSSKVGTKQPDARTGHDKDGNEEHTRNGQKAG